MNYEDFVKQLSTLEASIRLDSSKTDAWISEYERLASVLDDASIFDLKELLKLIFLQEQTLVTIAIYTTIVERARWDVGSMSEQPWLTIGPGKDIYYALLNSLMTPLSSSTCRAILLTLLRSSDQLSSSTTKGLALGLRALIARLDPDDTFIQELNNIADLLQLRGHNVLGDVIDYANELQY